MKIDAHRNFTHCIMFPLEIQEETAVFTGFFQDFVEWERPESKAEAIRAAIYFFLHFLRSQIRSRVGVKMREGADKAKI